MRHSRIYRAFGLLFSVGWGYLGYKVLHYATTLLGGGGGLAVAVGVFGFVFTFIFTVGLRMGSKALSKEITKFSK